MPSLRDFTVISSGYDLRDGLHRKGCDPNKYAKRNSSSGLSTIAAVQGGGSGQRENDASLPCEELGCHIEPPEWPRKMALWARAGRD